MASSPVPWKIAQSEFISNTDDLLLCQKSLLNAQQISLPLFKSQKGAIDKIFSN